MVRTHNDEPDPNWPELAEDHSSLSASYYSGSELSRYRYIMESDLSLEACEVDYWMSVLRYGSDQPLKVLLISLLPRIDRLNLIAYAFNISLPQVHMSNADYSYNSWGMDESTGFQCLTFLCPTISSIYHDPQGTWPVGFLSLRKISLGTPTDLNDFHGQSSRRAAIWFDFAANQSMM